MVNTRNNESIGYSIVSIRYAIETNERAVKREHAPTRKQQTRTSNDEWGSTSTRREQNIAAMLSTKPAVEWKESKQVMYRVPYTRSEFEIEPSKNRDSTRVQFQHPTKTPGKLNNPFTLTS